MYEEGTQFFEDLVVGESHISPGRTVTEGDIVTFAGLSWDFNVLHTDEEFMKKSQFGRRIAHGLLGLAIQSGLSYRAFTKPTATIAFLGLKEWNFKKPIFIGDTVRLRLTIAEKREAGKPDRGIVTWKRELLNQDDEVVQEGTTATLVKRRG